MRKYVRAGNVTWSGINLDDIKEMDFTPAEFEVFRLRKGDLLIVEGSGSAAEVGKPAVWNDEVQDCCFQNTLIRVRAPAPLVPFLYGHFKKDAITGAFARSSRGIGIHHVGAKALEDWPVDVPPLNEQKRIVAKIEALQARSDAAKEALDAIPPLLEKFRQSVLAAAFRGDLTKKWREAHPDVEPASKLLERIRAERRRKWEEANPKKKYVEPEPVDTEGLPELPKGWCWAGLNEVMRKITDGTHFTPEYLESGVPFLSVKDVRQGILHFDDCKYISDSEHAELFKRCDPEFGDVLVTKSGTIGRVAVVRTARPFSLFVSVAVLKPASPLVDPEWVAFAFEQWMSTINVKNDIKGSAVKNLHLEDFRKLKFALAPVAEQIEVLAQLADRIAAIDATMQRIVAMRGQVGTLNQSILAKAFRGELVPQDPNDEPASVLLERIRQQRETPSPTATTAPKSRGKRG